MTNQIQQAFYSQYLWVTCYNTGLRGTFSQLGNFASDDGFGTETSRPVGTLSALLLHISKMRISTDHNLGVTEIENIECVMTLES